MDSSPILIKNSSEDIKISLEQNQLDTEKEEHESVFIKMQFQWNY